MPWHPFKKQEPEAREAELLHEARLAALEHQCAANHHQSLASMYAQRVDWLTSRVRLRTQQEPKQ